MWFESLLSIIVSFWCFWNIIHSHSVDGMLENPTSNFFRHKFYLHLNIKQNEFLKKSTTVFIALFCWMKNYKFCEWKMFLQNRFWRSTLKFSCIFIGSFWFFFFSILTKNHFEGPRKYFKFPRKFHHSNCWLNYCREI